MYGQNNGYYMPYQNPYMQNGAMPDMLSQMKGPYQQPQVIPTQPAQISKPYNDMLWVLNENEATSYPVAPNNSVVLWDKNEPTIYVKSVNSQGVPSMRILDFTERTETHGERTETHACNCKGEYVTIAEFDALKAKFYDLLSRYDGLLLEQKGSSVEKQKATDKKTKEEE